MNQFWAQSNIMRNSVDVMVSEPRDDGAMVWSITIENKFVKAGAVPIDPSFSFGRRDAQSLLDALIEAGLRPSKLEPLEPTVAAMAKHIAFAERVSDQLLVKVTR